MASRAIAVGERVAAIDAVRGAAILLMALGNFGLGIRWVPAWLKHAADVGFTIGDLVAPLFIVTLAFTARPSLQRRIATDGLAHAVRHSLSRSAALIAMGAIFTAGQAALQPEAGVQLTWGVLQAIGTASLLALPFLLLPTYARLVGALLLLGGFQWMLDRVWLSTVLHAEHNGIWGSLSWAGLLLLGTVVADAYHAQTSTRDRRNLLMQAGLGALALALALSEWVPISKHRASATYMLLSLGLSVLLLATFEIALRGSNRRAVLLQQFGRNPLILYLANLLLLGVFALPHADGWYAGAPVWLSLFQAAVILTMNVTLARELDRRNLWVRL